MHTNTHKQIHSPEKAIIEWRIVRLYPKLHKVPKDSLWTDIVMCRHWESSPVPHPRCHITVSVLQYCCSVGSFYWLHVMRENHWTGEAWRPKPRCSWLDSTQPSQLLSLRAGNPIRLPESQLRPEFKVSQLCFFLTPCLFLCSRDCKTSVYLYPWPQKLLKQRTKTTVSAWDCDCCLKK